MTMDTTKRLQVNCMQYPHPFKGVTVVSLAVYYIIENVSIVKTVNHSELPS